MNRLLPLAIVLCSAAPASAALTLEEIHTASNNVLVAYFKSTAIKANEVNTTDLSAWKLNGEPVTAIHKFVTEADACEHHVYLQVPTLVNGTRYTLQTPHGDSNFVFDDHKVFCESIKTNQNAYSALSRVRMPISPSGWAMAARSRSAAACRRIPFSDCPAVRALRTERWKRWARTHLRATSCTASIWRGFPQAAPTRSP